MRRSSWQWKEKLSVAISVALFLIFLGPMFKQSHPMGSNDFTVRIIGDVFLSGISAVVGGAFLYFMLKG
jgi:hypothetical protein